MTLSSFRINQPPGTPGPAWDRARRDLTKFSVSGDLVECEAENKSETSYLWEIISAPLGTTVVINNSTTHTCNFQLESSGGYLIRLTVNEGEITEHQTSLYMGIPLPNSGACLPALNETNQDNSQSPYDGSRGYEEKVNQAFTFFDGGFVWNYDSLNDYNHPLLSTTGVKVGGGSLSSPGIGFYNDPNTGLINPEADSIGFVCGGSEFFRLKNDAGNTYQDIPGLSHYRIRNYSNTAAANIKTSIITEVGSSGDEAHTEILAVGANSKTVSAKFGVSSPGGTLTGDIIVDSTGVAGGNQQLNVKVIGAGTPTLEISSETVGAGTSTVSLLSHSVGGNSSLSLSSTSDGGDSDLEIKANGDGTSSIVIDPNGPSAASYLLLGNGHGEILFSDYYRGSSSYSQNLKLAGSVSEWDNYAARYGATANLLAAVYTAGVQTLQSAYNYDPGIITSLANGPVVISSASDAGDYALSVNGMDVSSSPGAMSVSVDGTATQSYIDLISDSTRQLSIVRYYDDGIHFALGANDYGGNTALIITTDANRLKDHNIDAAVSYPRLFLFSNSDVAEEDTEWLYIAHSGARGNIYCNVGPVSINNSSAGYSQSSGLVTPHLEVNGRCHLDGALYYRGNTVTPSAGTLTFDIASYSYFFTSLSQSITTVSFTKPTGVSSTHSVFYVKFFAFSIGRTVDGFSGTWKWDGSSPPFSIAANKYRLLQVSYDFSNDEFIGRISGDL